VAYLERAWKVRRPTRHSGAPARSRTRNSIDPRVDDRHGEIVEVRGIPGRECGMTGKHYTCDHCVPQFAGAPFSIPKRHQIAGLLGGSRIKKEQPAAQSCR
jgi:hypothetical protein